VNRIEGHTGSLAYGVSGPSDFHPLVLLHSLGTSSEMWRDQLGLLATRRRVVTVDLPGHGGSSSAPGEYALEDLGADIVTAVDAAGVDRFDVCGMSLGGLLSLWLAIERPERVTRLIACNTASRIGTREGWTERIAAVADHGMAGVRDTVVARFVTAGLRDRRPEAVRRLGEMFVAVDPVGYTGCCAALRDADVTADIARIACPTLLVGGDEDVSTPPSTTLAMHELIPDSQVQVIPGAAHLSNIDQPDVFSALLTGFLQSSATPPL
jgi:3-oxoadipate enol-lactonase